MAVLGIDGDGVALIPEVPSGLPAPALPAFDRVGRLVPGALAIALMVVLESLSVARAVRTRDEPAIDNDQELAAAGGRRSPARSSRRCRRPAASPRPR